jgi:A/G-specific adenine glycosylase
MTEISEKTPLLGLNEVHDLMDWFHRHSIDYPWGDNPTPYRVWISEIMLQQTVVTAAIDHFIRWMDLFPDIQSLTEAREQTVLKAWEGLGYYSRARNILKGALFLTEYHHGTLPSSYEELIKVPGIGDYTARAILSLAFSRRTAAFL